MKARWRAAGIVLVLAALLASIGTANAARLPLSGATLTTLPVFTRCTNEVQVEPGAVRQNGTSTSVVVRGLTPRCAGARVELTIVQASGAVVRRVSGSVPTSGPATVTLGAPAFTPAQGFRVFATVGTWGVPATWTYAPPTPVTACTVWRETDGDTVPVPGVSCAIRATSVLWGNEWSRQLHLHLVVTTSKNLKNDEYVRFTYVAPTTGVPNWWSWAQADVSEVSFVSGAGGLTSRCSELPVLSGRTPSTYGVNNIGLYIQLTQGGSRGFCQPG